MAAPSSPSPPTAISIRTASSSACRDCAIRHFCGFYEEQARYAFRLIADGIADDYLWDNWDDGTDTVFNYALR